VGEAAPDSNRALGGDCNLGLCFSSQNYSGIGSLSYLQPYGYVPLLHKLQFVIRLSFMVLQDVGPLLSLMTLMHYFNLYCG
jgi:hypothetical protein